MAKAQDFIDFGGGAPSGPSAGKSNSQDNTTELDPILTAIRIQIIAQQEEFIKTSLSAEIDEAQKIKLSQIGLKEFLTDNANKDKAQTILSNPEIVKKLNNIEVTGYKDFHEQFKNNFHDIEWKADGNDVRSNEVHDKDGNKLCTLTETTHKTKPMTVTLADGSEQTVSSYRTIDFPTHLDVDTGPVHMSMAVKDANGNNIAESEAVYFTAHYGNDGKLLEITSPQPIKFMGDGPDAVGYIERNGQIYTLAVTQEKYKAMQTEVSKNKGMAFDISEQVVARAADKTITGEKSQNLADGGPQQGGGDQNQQRGGAGGAAGSPGDGDGNKPPDLPNRDDNVPDPSKASKPPPLPNRGNDDQGQQQGDAGGAAGDPGDGGPGADAGVSPPIFNAPPPPGNASPRLYFKNLNGKDPIEVQEKLAEIMNSGNFLDIAEACTTIEKHKKTNHGFDFPGSSYRHAFDKSSLDKAAYKDIDDILTKARESIEESAKINKLPAQTELLDSLQNVIDTMPPKPLPRDTGPAAGAGAGNSGKGAPDPSQAGSPPPDLGAKKPDPKGKPSPDGGGRASLLDAIRKGKQLKKASDRDEPGKKGAGGDGQDAGGGLAGSLANALGKRRNAMQSNQDPDFWDDDSLKTYTADEIKDAFILDAKALDIGDIEAHMQSYDRATDDDGFLDAADLAKNLTQEQWKEVYNAAMGKFDDPKIPDSTKDKMLIAGGKFAKKAGVQAEHEKKTEDHQQAKEAKQKRGK